MPEIIIANHSTDALNRAIGKLRAGELVAIPTETVYGLAADATSGEAVAKIFATKQRPSFNPLICHVDGVVMAQQYGKFDMIAERLANTFWPGPLTLILPLVPESGIHDLVTAGLDSIGLRCPRGFSRQVISAFGRPLAAPSANRSGRISPTTAQHVAADFAGTDLLILDAGACEAGLESTIVKIDGNRLILLRPGVITAEEIADVAGKPVDLPDTDGKVLAPGMMKSHYAPDAQVMLDCETCPDGAAWLGFGNRAKPANAAEGLNLSETSNLVEAAANLYAYLKQLDESGADLICVSPIPREELGIAINDRLQRAAAPRPSKSGEPG
ncbi:MAG: threonylcarbamoyl-AMP synthase [Nitratireductor sp.]|nr:threonylcarbamoyl-AMP synthase [Nitratireductor sp.]